MPHPLSTKTSASRASRKRLVQQLAEADLDPPPRHTRAHGTRNLFSPGRLSSVPLGAFTPPPLMLKKKRTQGIIALFIVIIAATASLTRTNASEEAVPPGHAIAVTIPDGWERRAGVADPILIAAVENGTGNTFGLLAFKQPNDKYTLKRESAETGLLNELGPAGKILRRVNTTLLGVSAYCVIAETQVQGRIVSLARIMAEKPVNGFVYVVQYSKLADGGINDASIKTVKEWVHMTKSK